MPSEPGKFIRVSVDLQPEEYHRLHAAAEVYGQSHAEFIRRAVRKSSRIVDVPRTLPEAKIK